MRSLGVHVVGKGEREPIPSMARGALLPVNVRADLQIGRIGRHGDALGHVALYPQIEGPVDNRALEGHWRIGGRHGRVA